MNKEWFYDRYFVGTEKELDTVVRHLISIGLVEYNPQSEYPNDCISVYADGYFALRSERVLDCAKRRGDSIHKASKFQYLGSPLYKVLNNDS